MIGWLVGVMLLWASDRWREGEKVLGTWLLPFGYFSLAVAGMFPGQTCARVVDESGEVIDTCTGGLPIWIGIPLLVLLATAPMVSIAVLAKRAAPNRA